MSAAQKCPECGAWWTWPTEHRCPSSTATNSASLVLPSSDADAPEPEGLCLPLAGSMDANPGPPVGAGDVAPGHLLLEAARRMREQHGPEHQRHAMWTAIADWLDRAAYLWDYGDVGGEHMSHALAVARAYLGTPPPDSP